MGDVEQSVVDDLQRHNVRRWNCSAEMNNQPKFLQSVSAFRRRFFYRIERTSCGDAPGLAWTRFPRKSVVLPLHPNIRGERSAMFWLMVTSLRAQRTAKRMC